MDRFSQLEAFIAVAEAEGFNAASRTLGKSPPTVTRLVAALEQRIGARLFLRTTRQIALTEAGERLFQDARRVLADLAVAEGSAAGHHEAPQGELSVTASTIFGRTYVAPLIQSFLEDHPAVTARLFFSDRSVNLIDEGLDVAIRLGELPDSSLTAMRVGTVRRIVVAAPDYIAKQGRPERLEDLANHRLVAPSIVSRAESWEFMAEGKKTNLAIRPQLVANTIDVAIDAAKSGWGITRVLSYQIAGALREGTLVEILPAFEDRTVPIHILHAEGPLRAAKIRAFVDHAARGLRKVARDWA